MPRALAPFALVCSLALAPLGCPAPGVDFQEVRRLQAEGRGEATIDPLRALLLEDPDNREASLLLGSALALSQRFGEAMFHLRRAARDGEFAIEAGLLLGATLLSIENHSAAIDAVDAVLESDPSLTMAWLIRGQAALLSSRPELALESAQRVRELVPADFSARVVEAGALMALGRNDEAERTFAELFELAPDLGPNAVAAACTEYARFQVLLKEDLEGARGTLDSCSDVLIQEALWVDAGARLYSRAGDDDAAYALARRALEANPEHHALRILLANALRQTGKPSEAEAELLAGTGFPHPTVLWVGLAKLRREQGDLGGALDAVDRALEAGEGDTEAHRFFRADILVDLARLSDARATAELLEEPVYRDIVIGRVELESGSPERALALFEGALQQWPDHAGVRVLAARAAHEIGDEDQALSHLVEATRAAPSDTDASLLLARLYLLRGEATEAYAYARRHIGFRGYGQAESLLVAAAAARAIDDPDGVRTALETLAKHPAHSALGVSELAAFAAETEGSDAGRAVLLDAGLDLAAPENDAALRRAVRIELDDGKADAALHLLDSVITTAPDHVSAHAIRAHVLLEQGDAAGARASFEAALALDPDHAESVAGLGQIAFAAGDLAGALSRNERAVALEPDEAKYRYELARTLLAGGSVAAAEEQLRTVLRTHPEHAAAANDLAWLLALRGESLERALLLAERAVRATPSPETRDTLGLVHLRAGRVDPAREAFEAALAERPEYATARYHLALAYLEQGDEAEARRALELALAGEPFSEAPEARAALARLGD